MKTNIKRRYQTVNRKKQKAMWKLLLAVTLGGVTAIIFPFALDVIKPQNNHFPQAKVIKQVVQAERESYLIPRKEGEKVETTKEEITRIAKEYCTEKGLGDYCWKDLVGMAWKESTFNCLAIGDSGKAYGCYQIHRGFHAHVKIEEARNTTYAVKWTLNRLIAKGYPEQRSFAIRSHNGSPSNPKTLMYLNAINEYIKSL